VYTNKQPDLKGYYIDHTVPIGVPHHPITFIWTNIHVQNWTCGYKGKPNRIIENTTGGITKWLIAAWWNIYCIRAETIQITNVAGSVTIDG